MSRYLRSARLVVVVAALLVGATACDLGVVPTAFGAGSGGTAPSGPPASPVAPMPSPLSERMGVVLGHFSAWAPEAEIRADLDAIVAAGARWVAIDFDWPSIEPRPGVYSWDQGGVGGVDRAVRMARERGLDVLGLIVYTPEWARPAACTQSDKCPPADPQTYARFARRVVERYAPQGVHHWQIWNEPNNSGFWKPRPDPRAYTNLLVAAYRQIKAADPSATVLAGGLSPGGSQPSRSHMSPSDFLTRIYLSGGGGSFDALAHHPYAFNDGSFPLNGHPLNGFVQTAFLHDVMAFVGDGRKKIWATEVGAPTGTAPGDSVSETMQVRILNEFLDGWDGWVNFRYPDHRRAARDFGAFTGPAFWYQARDQGTDPRDREQNFGLLRHDGSPKPSYAAFCRRASGPGCRAADPGSGAEAAAAAPVGSPGSRLTVQYAGRGRAAAANPVTGGYYVLEPTGTVRAYAGAPGFGSPRFGWDIARALAVMPDGAGYVVLDGFGGVHRFGSARNLPTGSTGYWRGWDIARSIAIAPDGRGYAVLDGFGGVRSVGSVAGLRGLPYWRGWDIARSLVLPASGGAYVLDGWGGVHAARGSRSFADLKPPFWRGRDVARDIQVTPSGRGFVVLDSHGGVHTRGDAARVAMPPIAPSSRSFTGIARSRGAYIITGRG